MKKQANPQGKGLVPVLDSLADSRARTIIPPKSIDQISSELFTSMFILHSQFSFKPVVGKPYYLYQYRGNFKLSMISPREWGGSDFGQYIGECVLQTDISWTLTLGAEAAKDESFMEYIEQQRKQFDDVMCSAESVDETLPVYLESLPFYQRVFASALANSLKISMEKSGMLGLSYSQVKGLLAKE